MQVQRHVRPVYFPALGVGTHEALVYFGGQSPVFLPVLDPVQTVVLILQSLLVWMCYFDLVDELAQSALQFRTLLDLRTVYLIIQIGLPVLLVVVCSGVELRGFQLLSRRLGYLELSHELIGVDMG